MTQTIDAIDLSADIIDVRDMIARYEELENLGTEIEKDDINERNDISVVLVDLCGNGGDEQWRGDWYPVTLIRESYFEEYAQELANDIGAVDNNASWPMNCIDWKRAARELLIDYTSIEIDGTTYYYR